MNKANQPPGINSLQEPSSNRLFPIFLKLRQLKLVLIGGGNVALEKLEGLLRNEPDATIKLVALQILPSVAALAEKHAGVHIIQKAYEPTDLDEADVVIAAVNDWALSEAIRNDAHARKLLINAADKPALCDFYLGSVVQKGHLKIGISTNGKSPTLAKRLKEMLNEVLPDELEELLDNLQTIRNSLTGDFTDKVKQLNELTKGLAANKDT